MLKIKPLLKKEVLTILLLVLSHNIAIASNKFYQDTLKIKPSVKAEQLEKANEFRELRKFCKQELPKFLNAKVKDSLEIAYLSYYQHYAHYHFDAYLESMKSIEQGINYTTNSEESLELKGMLYYKKAYLEGELSFVKRSLKSMQMASNILSQLKKPNYDYSIGAYTFLSINASYNGNLGDALRYIRLAEKIYLNNKATLDLARTEPDGNYDRYEVILPYKKIYAIYKQGKTKKDSITLVNLINTFEALHKAPEFNAMYERVYYTTALNHVGDWYASKKSEDLTTEADLEKAHYYLNKSIDLVENKGYPGNIVTYKYNKAKAYLRSNNLEAADSLMTNLIIPLSENDGRRPFFLAQKGLIKAKLKRKDSALHIFYKAIENIHQGEDTLTKDYKNFKPSESIGHTKLLLRINQELNKYYPKDTLVQAKVAKFYHLALIQFENSYNKAKFNRTYSNYLREIVQGILKSKKNGYGLNFINDNDLLNRSEIIQNQLAWEQFNQNRFTNNLQKLDSLKFRNLELRSQLVNAKQQDNLPQQDSIRQLTDKHKNFTKKQYPNKDLLTESSFNLEMLQNQMQDDELVVKYLIFENTLLVYSIYKNNFKIEFKPWHKSKDEIVKSFSEHLKSKNYNATQAKELTKILLPEIRDDIKTLVINPDGILYQFPFEILMQDDAFLTQKFTIRYTSNLGFIYPDLKQKQVQESDLAIYVPEYEKVSTEFVTRSKPVFLAGAKKEAQNISKLFPSIIYDKDLTKHQFIETAAQPKLLHLAMHAEINNDTPELSRLLFSDKPSKNEDLYLEEIYGLNLNADLTVLSACNTGIGKENAGKSMESFQRAFTFAGVPATVASLWEVPDNATQQIMQSFYKNLKKGLSKSIALKKAKLDYLKVHANTKLAQPYYWAGFVLYGEDKAIVNNSSKIIWYSLIAVGILIFSIVFYNKKRQKRDVA